MDEERGGVAKPAPKRAIEVTMAIWGGTLCAIAIVASIAIPAVLEYFKAGKARGSGVVTEGGIRVEKSNVRLWCPDLLDDCATSQDGCKGMHCAEVAQFACVDYIDRMSAKPTRSCFKDLGGCHVRSADANVRDARPCVIYRYDPALAVPPTAKTSGAW